MGIDLVFNGTLDVLRYHERYFDAAVVFVFVIFVFVLSFLKAGYGEQKAKYDKNKRKYFFS